MSNNPSTPAIAGGDVRPNATGPGVDPTSGGEDVQKPTERTYTTEQFEFGVKERLLREQKKFAKERADLEHKLAEHEKRTGGTNKVNPNVEEEYKSKLATYETQNRTLVEQVNKYRNSNLDSTVEKALAAQGCLDPELALADLKNKQLVHLDDDGEIIVEGPMGDLAALVKDYLARKPHLVTAQRTSGVGTRSPANLSAQSGDPARMSADELGAMLGIAKKKPLFSR